MRTNSRGEGNIPGVGKVSANTTGEAAIDFGIGKFSAKLKSSPDARARLRQHLEPQTDSLIELINQELLKPAHKALQAQGKQGLVMIVDSLDRLENTKDRNQAEYLFVTRGEKLGSFLILVIWSGMNVKGLQNDRPTQRDTEVLGYFKDLDKPGSPKSGKSQKLRQFRCHVVYTLPLVLTFSNSIAPLRDRFGGDPKVLPMVRVQSRNETLHPEGIALLREMNSCSRLPRSLP